MLRRLASGDENAFNMIYHRYNAVIFNAAMAYVKDIDLARDIVQQVFIKLWKKRVMVTGIDNFQHYIVVSSRNLIYDQFRKANAEARKIAELAKREGGVSLHTGSGHVEEREYTQIIHAAIAKLPPQQKKIYRMIQEEQLSYKEAASTLGLSAHTVKKHMELARRSVREYVIKKSIQ